MTSKAQVCGGNAGLLLRVAVAVKAEEVKDIGGNTTYAWNWDAGGTSLIGSIMAGGVPFLMVQTKSFFFPSFFLFTASRSPKATLGHQAEYH